MEITKYSGGMTGSGGIKQSAAAAVRPVGMNLKIESAKSDFVSISQEAKKMQSSDLSLMTKLDFVDSSSYSKEMQELIATKKNEVQVKKDAMKNALEGRNMDAVKNSPEVRTDRVNNFGKMMDPVYVRLEDKALAGIPYTTHG